MTFGIAYSLFIVSLLFFIWQALFIQTAQKDVGKARLHNLHAPVIEFITEDKKTILFHTKVFEYPPTHNRGDEVSILYSP